MFNPDTAIMHRIAFEALFDIANYQYDKIDDSLSLYNADTKLVDLPIEIINPAIAIDHRESAKCAVAIRLFTPKGELVGKVLYVVSGMYPIIVHQNLFNPDNIIDAVGTESAEPIEIITGEDTHSVDSDAKWFDFVRKLIWTPCEIWTYKLVVSHYPEGVKNKLRLRQSTTYHDLTDGLHEDLVKITDALNKTASARFGKPITAK